MTFADDTPKAVTEGPAFMTFDEPLTGWKVEGTATTRKEGKKVPVWSPGPTPRHLLCRGAGFGFLRYRKAVSDFTLALEFKMKANCNSGVCFRAESYKSHLNFFGGRPSQTGYEIQLLDDHKREAHPKGSGALYRYRAPRENAMKPADHWNSLSLECRGSRLKVKMNGIVIHDFDQNEEASVADKPLSGFLSLQNHGGEILFRNIELEVHEPKHDVAPAP